MMRFSSGPKGKCRVSWSAQSSASYLRGNTRSRKERQSSHPGPLVLCLLAFSYFPPSCALVPVGEERAAPPGSSGLSLKHDSLNLEITIHLEIQSSSETFLKPCLLFFHRDTNDCLLSSLPGALLCLLLLITPFGFPMFSLILISGPLSLIPSVSFSFL